MTVTCPICEGQGGSQVTVFYGRGPNECYPDAEECGACDGVGTLPTQTDADHIEAIEEDAIRQENKWLAEEEAYYANLPADDERRTGFFA